MVTTTGTHEQRELEFGARAGENSTVRRGESHRVCRSVTYGISYQYAKYGSAKIK